MPGTTKEYHGSKNLWSMEGALGHDAMSARNSYYSRSAVKEEGLQVLYIVWYM